MKLDTRNAPSFTVYKKTQVDNGIGGFKESNKFIMNIKGFLDLNSGSERTTYGTFMQESTHILLTDYVEGITNDMILVDSNKNVLQIDLVDNPVSLNQHLEIYVRFTGTKFNY